MKQKNKGRKIYKTKEKNYYGKSTAGKAFSVGLTILLIGGIGFLGYSIAEPIIKYTKKKGDDGNNSSITSMESPSEAENASNAANIPPVESIGSEDYKAAALTKLDMTSIDSVKAAINRIPANAEIEYVEVPLKVSGGEIYFQSSVFYATQSGAIQSFLDLKQVVEEIEGAGYKSAAVISTFKDNILPAINREGGYKTQNTDEQWIDNDYDAGGKPWASPFSDIAVSYNMEIIGEATAAGFDKIICSDLVYPEFRDSDIELLGDRFKGTERCMAMTSAANAFYDKILKAGSTMQIEVSASDLLKRNNDIISQPMLLSISSIIVNIDIDEISYGVYTKDTVYEFSGTAADKVKKMLDLINNELSGFRNVAVRISGTSVGTDELLKAKEKISDFGYRSFVIG